MCFENSSLMLLIALVCCCIREMTHMTKFFRLLPLVLPEEIVAVFFSIFSICHFVLPLHYACATVEMCVCRFFLRRTSHSPWKYSIYLCILRDNQQLRHLRWPLRWPKLAVDENKDVIININFTTQHRENGKSILGTWKWKCKLFALHLLWYAPDWTRIYWSEHIARLLFLHCWKWVSLIGIHWPFLS